MFRVAKLTDAREYLEQRLLRYFFGVFGMAAHQPAIVKQLGAEVVDESFERVRRSRRQSARQTGFGFKVQARL